MKDVLEEKIKALTEKTLREGKPMKMPPLRNRSSLHKIIKTKAQADLFMKMLKSC